MATNDLAARSRAFDGLTPWAGNVPEGFIADFLGGLTDMSFLPEGASPRAPARSANPALPVIGDGDNGEPWLEAVDWLEAARAAVGHFTMITLGANYGAQAVGAWLAVQWLNPMPCRLVLVEPEPTNFERMVRHLRTNGINPNDHWLIRSALNDTGDPVFFTVGAPGSGSQKIVGREAFLKKLTRLGRARKSLRSLVRSNTTGIVRPLVPGYDWQVEVKLMSAIRLPEILGPLDFVDYLESDIQQAEEIVFPPFVDLLRRKVRRVHIGTHGSEVHTKLRTLFADDGWEIVFDYPPETRNESSLGPFLTNDGVLTAVNPRL